MTALKWLPLFAAALFALCALLWLGHDPFVARELHGPGSSLDLDDAGSSRLRAYLEGPAQRRVTSLIRPVSQEALPADGVLFRIRPQQGHLRLREILEQKGKKTAAAAADFGVLDAAESTWVASGGRMILAIDAPYRGLRSEYASAPVQTVLPVMGAAWTIKPHLPHTLVGPATESAVTVVVAGDQPVLMRQRLGAGDVWLLAVPEIWSNQQLAEADHLALALALVGNRPVWFDEAAHALTRDVGALELARRWGLGPLLLIGLLVCLAYAWRHGRILGPPADPWRDHRSEAIDGIAALAVLYGRALTDRALLSLFQRRLVRETTLLVGLPPAKAAELVTRQLGPLPSVATFTRGSAALFAARLALLNTAYRNLRHEHRRRRR